MGLSKGRCAGGLSHFFLCVRGWNAVNMGLRGGEKGLGKWERAYMVIVSI